MSREAQLIVLILVSTVFIGKCFLAIRQKKYLLKWGEKVPRKFEETFSPADMKKAKEYNLAKINMSFIHYLISAITFLGWTLAGGLSWLQDFYVGIESPVWQSLAILFSIFFIEGIISLPLSLYSQFVIEQRFGFNKSNFKIFITDLVKGLVLGSILGVLLGYPVFYLMGQFSWWWIAAWGVYSLFQLLILMIFPTIIAPLFNKFSRLENQELAARIERLVKGAGFNSEGVFVMDASKRSSHGNAYFTGIGRAKRIVFFDTLLEKLKAHQVIAVLAHEVGHLYHGHVKKRMLLSFVMSFVLFFVMGMVSQKQTLFDSLGLPVLPVFILLMVMWGGQLLGFFFSPLSNWWSRKDEFEADQYAVKNSSAQDLEESLVSLYRDNAGSLWVDPWYARWYLSHPPLLERVAHMK